MTRRTVYVWFRCKFICFECVTPIISNISWPPGHDHDMAWQVMDYCFWEKNHKEVPNVWNQPVTTRERMKEEKEADTHVMKNV